jgi:AraC-like DNA-binding protein
MEQYRERGYLRTQFRVFHLSEPLRGEVPFHYHDFKKILLCLSDEVGYVVEGKQYLLGGGDVILIGAGEMHRPLVPPEQPYHRIILYLSDGFLSGCTETDLSSCFQQIGRSGAPLCRGNHASAHRLTQAALAMTEEACQDSIAPHTLQRCRVTEFLLLLNAMMQQEQDSAIPPDSQNQIVTRAIDYIGGHLSEPLTVSDIADQVHANKSYLMHLFKAETGYTIKEYLTEKRLFQAKALMSCCSITEACYKSGFTNYTSFYRAYLNRYGVSPRQDNRQDRQSLSPPLRE